MGVSYSPMSWESLTLDNIKNSTTFLSGWRKHKMTRDSRMFYEERSGKVDRGSAEGGQIRRADLENTA